MKKHKTSNTKRYYMNTLSCAVHATHTSKHALHRVMKSLGYPTLLLISRSDFTCSPRGLARGTLERGIPAA